MQGLAGCIADHPLPHLLISPYDNAVLIANGRRSGISASIAEGFANIKFSDLFEQEIDWLPARRHAAGDEPGVCLDAGIAPSR